MRQFNTLDFVHEWTDTRQSKPPKEPGVYFIYYALESIFGVKCYLIYIGSSSNLYRRISNHPQLKGYSGDDSKFRITYYLTDDYRNLEIEAIKRFAPLANIHHNHQD